MKIRKNQRKTIIFLFLLVLIAVLLISYFKYQKVPVSPRYSSLINNYIDQARQRDSNALKIYEMNINRIINEYEPKLNTAADEAAKETASYSSCCAIIYYMAWDKIKNQNETDEYMQQKIRPFLEPLAKSFEKEMNDAFAGFEYELKKSTVQLANDLAAINKNDGIDITTNVDELSKPDIQQALRNLGFNSPFIGASIALDLTALYKSNFGKFIAQKIKSIAADIFAKQIPKVVALPVIAGADGPLPFGDIIALIGGLWTAYDIHSSQKEFEAEITTSLKNMIVETKDTAHKQSINQAKNLMEKYQVVQGEIETQTISRLE